MSRRKMLVVDDEPDIVELVSYNLKKEGFDVSSASDGEEALGMIKKVVAKLRAVLSKQPEAKPQLRIAAAGVAPKQDRAAMFARRDKDNDGKLTKEEFLIGQPDPEEAPKRFPRFDTDGDGVLSREAFISAGKGPMKPAQAK